MKIAEVRHPVGNLRIIQRQREPVLVGHALGANQRVILMHHPNEHTDVLPFIAPTWANQRLRRIACVLNRFPTGLKK
ncbi:hypothetical protein D3C72_1077840 [compost metagenome]